MPLSDSCNAWLTEKVKSCERFFDLLRRPTSRFKLHSLFSVSVASPRWAFSPVLFVQISLPHAVSFDHMVTSVAAHKLKIPTPLLSLSHWIRDARSLEFFPADTAMFWQLYGRDGAPRGLQKLLLRAQEDTLSSGFMTASLNPKVELLRTVSCKSKVQIHQDE